MTLKCSHCGAPLQAAGDQTLVTCGYCHSTTRVRSTRHQPRAKAQPGDARPTRMLVFGLAGAVTTAGLAAFVAFSSSRQAGGSTAGPADNASPTKPPPVAEAPDPITTERPVTPPAAADEPQAPDAPSGSAGSSSTRPSKPATGKPREPTGPIATKKEAEAILRPAVLACMKEHGVHYLITRVGNEPRGGTVPPLGLTGTSVVDYQPTPNFASTPLGQCVARAASAVRAPAYGGNYIYFGLRLDSIADPLADAPARLDTTAAKKALAALDDEARDCATRSPAGSRPGEEVRLMVYFLGATGQVSKVEPYYVDAKSPYGRCVTAVYRKATVDKFRAIDQHVLHILEP